MPAHADPKGYYAILGVAPTASAEEIRVGFREQARLFHPDQGGAHADEERFARIREAYGVLRDARSRMQYDALRLTVEEQPRYRREEAAESAATPASPFGRVLRIVTGGSAMALAAAAMAVLLIVTLVMLWSARGEVAERDLRLDEMRARLAAALEDQADVRARYRGANFIRLEEALERAGEGNGASDFVFHRELVFADGSSELDRDLRGKMDRTVVDLAATIARIPGDRDWLILVEGHTGEAARENGIAVEAWELSLLRLGQVVDHLVGQGVPADRLGVRFQAGFQPVGEDASTGHTIEIKLLCCYR
ncbi:MAG: DnaJ domain-containing protein [Geminicoccaceae bacterium]|nr:DnaJ domain-containing protein [Geminicoccaceae bacterium]